MINKYRFQIRRVDGIRKHPLLLQLKTELFKHFVEETKEIGAANIPIITEDGLLISNPFDFDASVENGEDEIMFRVEPDLNEGNILRALAHSFNYHHLCQEDKMLLIKAYTEEFERNKKWSDAYGGDINDKLSKVLGCHKETIKYAKRMVKEPEHEDDTNKVAEVKSFRFNTASNELRFDGKKYRLVGSPKQLENKIVYAFISENSEISITIKQKDPLAIVKKCKSVELKVNFNPEGIMKERLEAHRRFVNNFLDRLIEIPVFKKVTAYVKKIQGREIVTHIDFKWEGRNCRYYLTDEGVRIINFFTPLKNFEEEEVRVSMREETTIKLGQIISPLKGLIKDELRFRKNTDAELFKNPVTSDDIFLPENPYDFPNDI